MTEGRDALEDLLGDVDIEEAIARSNAVDEFIADMGAPAEAQGDGDPGAEYFSDADALDPEYDGPLNAGGKPNRQPLRGDRRGPPNESPKAGGKRYYDPEA